MVYTVRHAPSPMMSYICYRNIYDVILILVTSSGCHFVKALSATVGYSLLAMITDICRHPTNDSRGAWPTVYACCSQIISEMLPEIHTMGKFDSQIIK